MLSNLYSDQRSHGYQGPSRAVSHPRACTVGGGAFATSPDGFRCVVAGKDVLRILRVRDPPFTRISDASSSKAQTQSSLAVDAGSRMCTGPGGATIEIGSNFWSSSGLKMDSTPTDVVWGRGNFDNKIVTSARNGEIIYWDINKTGSKCETRIKEHKRAINKLAISPFLPYLIASGSQDGYLRVWDLRTPPSSSMKVYHPTGIRTLALCPVPSNPLTVCTGLESGNMQRWDIRNKASPLERITLAHSASILSMDWQLPSMRETGLGWIVTSGMDRRVKVWDLCLPSGSAVPAHVNDREALLLNKRMGPRPFRTLHTAFPVRNVCWRPGYDCEIAVASNNESESETVEVWDIRRGWIAKWALDGAEGGITDIAFASSHTLWAQHTSGTFAQHDLRESYRPLDAIPRVAMSWAASGDLAFVANKQPAVEIPFDDVDPLKKTTLNELRLRPKATGDPMYVPFQQTMGTYRVASFNHVAFSRLAKSYKFEGDRLWVCQTNAETAREAGLYHAAQIWHLVLSQLTELREQSSSPSVSSPALAPQINATLPSLPPLAGSGLSMAASEAPTGSNTSRPQSSANKIETRTFAFSLLQLDHGQARHGQDTPPSSNSSSPGPRTIALRDEKQVHQALLHTSQTSLYASSSLLPRSPASRRASTALPATPRPSRPAMRRASVSTPGLASGSPTSDGMKIHKHAHVGEGALDDSDSESNSEVSEVSGSGGGVATALEPVPHLKRNAEMLPSPLSRPSVSRKSSPDGHLAGDERSVGEYDSDATDSPRSTSSSSDSRCSSRRRRSVRSPQRNVQCAFGKQESQSSIRTVTAPLSDPPSAQLRPLPEDDSHIVPAPSNDILLAQRPSLTPGLGLGLSNMDEHREINKHTQHAHTLQNLSRLSETRKWEIRAAEMRLRDIGWRALRDALEFFAEKGDVQMCALLAIVVPAELSISAGRAARFVEAYVDLLARMQLHTVAARIRKHTQYTSVGEETQVQTVVFSSCGQCRKPIKTSAGTGTTLCPECRTHPTLCAVCHLPARKLLLHCVICGHGTHITCLRTFYLARPLTLLSTHSAHTARSPEDSSGSTGTSSVSTTYYSLSEETEEEEDEGGVRKDEDVGEGRDIPAAKMRVFGHACAAGCGHYCWAAARPP